MRVSSLSDERVLGLIRRHFVAAWLSRDRYQLDGPDKAEQEELRRIDRQRHDRRLEGGTVCVHLLAPDGTVTATLPVQKASDPAKLKAFLEDFIEREKVKPRPETRPAAPARPRARADGAVTLRVWTRFDDKGPNRGLSADRLELTAARAAAFVPARGARVGDSWKLAADGVDPIISYFYPPLPHWDVRESKVVDRTLTATVVAASEKEVRLRLEGRVELLYPYTGKPTDGRVTAKLLGTATVDPATRTLTGLALASEEAEYVWYWKDKPQPRKMSIAVELEQ
jgi:hypothetical protein